MVTHFVFGSCVVMAVSKTSNVPFFLSFFTSDLTAFSLHFSSCSDRGSPFRKPKSLLTMGGENGNRDDIFFTSCCQDKVGNVCLETALSADRDTNCDQIYQTKKRLY